MEVLYQLSYPGGSACWLLNRRGAILEGGRRGTRRRQDRALRRVLSDVHPKEDIGADLEPGLEPRERKELEETGRHLRAMRPSPAPGFERALRERLAAQPPSPRPERARRWSPLGFRALAGAYTGAGACLLAIAALGVAGAGPFAPS